MFYQAVKHLHIACVILSGCGFFLRGLLMVRGSPWLRSPWARRVPDTVDSLLLASALTLAFLLGQYPFVDGWLTAKVLGLLAYIGLGMAALRQGLHESVRFAAWLAALAVFGYIVSVALSKNPAGFLAAI
ncbi:MAG: SirB2 family protein [Rhodocyclaceae bacterium]|nr:SirB2 family protein [Rhodocyclaceae bacterium]